MDKRHYILSKFPGKTPNSSGKIHTHCPFHDDRHASFSIDVDKGGLFICGSRKCGVKGSFPLFYKMMEGIDNWKEVYEAISERRVSKHLTLDLETQTKPKSVEVIDSFPIHPFIKHIESVDSISYLRERNLTDEICDLFGIVYGRDGEFSGVNIHNTLVVPIFDLDGCYKTFQVRNLGASKKLRWKFPSNSCAKEHLYAGWLVSKGDGYLWVVEGISDVWNLRVHGIQAVGIFSSGASCFQLNKINQLCVALDLTPVVCLDGDVSSDDPMEVDYGLYLQKELMAYGLNSRIIHLNKDEDPGSLSKERIDQIRKKCYYGGNDEQTNVNEGY